MKTQKRRYIPKSLSKLLDGIEKYTIRKFPRTQKKIRELQTEKTDLQTQVLALQIGASDLEDQITVLEEKNSDLAYQITGLRLERDIEQKKAQQAIQRKLETIYSTRQQLGRLEKATRQEIGMILRRELFYLPEKELKKKLKRLNLNRKLLAELRRQRGDIEVLEKQITLFGSGEISRTAYILAQTNKTFRKTPLAIVSKDSVPYISKTFDRLSNITDIELLEIIKESGLQNTLKRRENYEMSFKERGFNLTFVPFQTEKTIVAYGAYFTPIKTEKPKSYKILKKAGTEAIKQLLTTWEGLKSPKLSYGI